jgi:hypothetical protein
MDKQLRCASIRRGCRLKRHPASRRVAVCICQFKDRDAVRLKRVSTCAVQAYSDDDDFQEARVKRRTAGRRSQLELAGNARGGRGMVMDSTPSGSPIQVRRPVQKHGTLSNGRLEAARIIVTAVGRWFKRPAIRPAGVAAGPRAPARRRLEACKGAGQAASGAGSPEAPARLSKGVLQSDLDYPLPLCMRLCTLRRSMRDSLDEPLGHPIWPGLD